MKRKNALIMLNPRIAMYFKNYHCRKYVNKFKRNNEAFNDLIKDENFFRKKLTQFLFSPRGAIFQVKYNIGRKFLGAPPL